MIRLLALTLAAGLVVACSQPSSQQSAATGQAATATPAQSAAPQAAPASDAAAAQPAPAPAQPAEAPPASAAPAAAAPPSTSAAAARPSTPSAAPPATTPAADRPVSVATPPPPPPEPTFREVTIPAGTPIQVKILSTLASNTSKVEDPVKGSVEKAVVISGATAIPAGSAITGSVIDVKESGRVKGKASLAIRFDRLTVRGETYKVQMARIAQEAAQNKKDDVKKGGLGAGLGAIVGGVAGGGKGAAIGAVAGGVGTVMATKGDEVQIAPGTVVTALLQDRITVSVPVK